MSRETNSLLGEKLNVVVVIACQRALMKDLHLHLYMCQRKATTKITQTSNFRGHEGNFGPGYIATSNEKKFRQQNSTKRKLKSWLILHAKSRTKQLFLFVYINLYIYLLAGAVVVDLSIELDDATCLLPCQSRAKSTAIANTIAKGLSNHFVPRVLH